jgi:hypothetical protein
VIVRQPASAPPPAEQARMKLTFDDAHLHLFDPATERRVEE